MLTTLISFFGGTAFRMIWGEISAWLTARQDHKYELERMKIQAQMEADQHARNLEAIRTQHALGVQVIRVQGEVDLSKIDAENFGKGLELANKSTGIKFIDGWNASIRASLATLMMWLVFMHFYNLNWKLDDRGWELAGAVFGIFIADRMLFRRGK